jgi:DNA-binding CsgD family transcriptional regulator
LHNSVDTYAIYNVNDTTIVAILKFYKKIAFFDNTYYDKELLFILTFNYLWHTTIGFSEREIAFLKLLCTEKTYKEIADELKLSNRQAEYLRDHLFERFGVKSRTGLAISAIYKGLSV